MYVKFASWRRNKPLVQQPLRVASVEIKIVGFCGDFACRISSSDRSLVGARRRKPDDVSIKLSLCGLLYNLIRRSQGSLPSGWSTGKEGTARVPVPKELRDSLSAIQQEWR